MSTGPSSPPRGPERRRAARISIPPGGPVSVVGARLVNVSSYGMMIESPVPLEFDAQLRFLLVVVGENADVEARVAACAPIAGALRRSYGVGLEFTRFAAEARNRLCELLASRHDAGAA